MQIFFQIQRIFDILTTIQESTDFRLQLIVCDCGLLGLVLEATSARIRVFLQEDQTLITSRDFGRTPPQVGSARAIHIKCQ